MKKIVGTLVCILVFSTFAGAISSTNTSTKSIDNEPANRAYSHTILGEFGTIRNCSPSKYSHWALKNIYYTGLHPFYYVTHVYDKNTHAYQRVKTELGLVASPTVFWDGGYRKDVGASSPSSAMAKYNTSIIQCGNRDVADIDLALDVEWLGAVNPYPENGIINVSVQSGISWTISEMEINVSVTNNEASLYNGHLHVYVTDINSTMWTDPFGSPYTYAFLDYAFNQNIGISADSTLSGSKNWDGLDYNDGTHCFENITQDNTMVIASVFNQSTNYSDETTGFIAGVGTDPKMFDVYFSNSTPPPKILENVTFKSFVPEEGCLEFNTTYYWKVDVWDALGNIIEGEIWSFTTRDNNPPYTPSDPIPPDGATNVSGGGICWTGGDPDGDYVTYDVYCGNTTPPPLVGEDVNVTCYYCPGNIKFNTTYYWKIVAKDEYHLYKPGWIYNTSGPIWSFTTQENLPPYEPSNPHPPDGGNTVPVNITLCWEGGDPNPGDYLYYDVYFGLTNPPTKAVSNQTGNYYSPVGPLEVFKTYYWRVVAWDSQGLSTSSPIWSFTTGINHPPSAPDIEGPTVKPVPRPLPTSGEPINYTFKSIDPDGHDVYYYIDWGDGSCEDWFGPFESGEEVMRNHTWIAKGTYDIRAKAKDIYDEESDWGYLDIIISKDKTFNFNFPLLSWLFNRFPNTFPILSFLLGL